ncbi:MAG: hypothetical protein U0168_23340 [Nannocystaceae bacterium]
MPSSASVQLDDGAATATDAAGGFSLGGVAAGTHALSAAAPGYTAAQLSVELAGYPGARVVVVLQPIPGEDGGGSGSEGTGGSAGDGASSGDPLDPAGGSSDEGTGGPAAPGGPGARPDTFGESAEAPAGCACAAGRPGRPAAGGWLGLLAVAAAAGLLRRKGAARAPARAPRTRARVC